MDGLNIKEVTQGYSGTGVSEAIRAINIGVIGNAVKALKESVGSCTTAVTEVWKGKSAEAFKSKLIRDHNDITAKLSEMQKSVYDRFQNIRNTIDESDAALEKSINNM